MGGAPQSARQAMASERGDLDGDKQVEADDSPCDGARPVAREHGDQHISPADVLSDVRGPVVLGSVEVRLRTSRKLRS